MVLLSHFFIVMIIENRTYVFDFFYDHTLVINKPDSYLAVARVCYPVVLTQSYY